MNTRKRIIIFSINYHPFVGGAEIAIKEISDQIPEIDFDMLTLRFDRNLPPFEKIGNTNVYRLGFCSDKPDMSDLVHWPLMLNKYLFLLLAPFKAWGLSKKQPYDAIWSMMAAYAGFAALFYKLLNSGLPFLLLSKKEIRSSISSSAPSHYIRYLK